MTTSTSDPLVTIVCSQTAPGPTAPGDRTARVSGQGDKTSITRPGRNQAHVITPRQIWARPLENGSWAAGLFNLGDRPAQMTIKWSDLGLAGRHIVRDLSRQKNLGWFQSEFTLTVSAHGAELVKISPDPAKR